MDQSTIRGYAQAENDYLLGLLLRADAPATGEDPQELAERNVGATARSFGETDPLHAMALNTLAFVYLYKGGDPQIAKDSTIKASEILSSLEGEEEMLLESKCLMVQAGIAKGATAAATIKDVFQLSALTPSDVEVAAQKLSEMLAASVFEKRLNRVLLIMTLRQLAVKLMYELEPLGTSATQESLWNNLKSFLDVYYSPEPDQ